MLYLTRPGGSMKGAGCKGWKLKTCSKCREPKDLSEYYKSKKNKTDGLQNYCKVCSKNGRNDWTKGNPEAIRLGNLWSCYRMTLDEYNALLVKQNFCCAGCGRHQSEFTKSFAVDHDHSCCPTKSKSCGECIRGLLCLACNTTLGNVRDDIEVLKNLITYIESGGVG